MSTNTEKELYRVLDAIKRLQKNNPNRDIDDSQVAQDLSVTIQDARDYMDLLVDQGHLTKEEDIIGGYSATLTPKGRTFLKDPGFFVDNTKIHPINLSGNFQGAIINFQSELTNVSQIINSSPSLGKDTKAQLQDQISELFSELKKAPNGKEDEVEAVLETAKTLVEALSKEKVNKPLINISADGLKKAAENIANVMPTVLIIVNQILVLLKSN